MTEEDLDPITNATIILQNNNRFADSILPKYMIMGANGKIYQTDDCHMLSLLGGLAADARLTPGGHTFSFGIGPDNSQPSGALNLGKFPVPPVSPASRASPVPIDTQAIKTQVIKDTKVINDTPVAGD